jgi:hypothetical protein
MRSRRGLLNSRAACVLVLIFCAIEAVWSWASISGSRHHEALIDILFFGFVIFIAISIAYRSSFWADRVAFAAVAGAFAFIVVRAAPLTTPWILALDAAHASMWTIAAVVSLIALARGSRAPGTT